MENGISDSSRDFWAASRKYGRAGEHDGLQSQEEDDDRYYTQKFDARCPVDASKVVHTVQVRKATCTRVEDTVEDFRCSRDSKCVKCTENYR